MTTLKVVTIFKWFIGIGEVVIVDALHEVSSSHFLKELGDEGLSSGEHDQQAKMNATPRKLTYVDSDKEAPAGSLARGFSDRFSLESSDTFDTRKQTRSASKSQRTPSKNKEPTHLRRSRRLEDRSITKEKARRERISIRSMDSFQGLTTKSPSSWHQPLAPKDLSLYDNESWNDPRDFTKPVKAIALPQDVPSTSDRRLIELKNQVQCLMEAHLAPTQPTQINKITTSCDICSGPYDTQYCMEDPEQAFVEYASSRTDKAGGCLSLKPISNDNKIETEPPQPEEPEPTLKDEFQDLHLNLPVLEVLANAPIYNAILDKYVEGLEIGKNESAFVQGEIPMKMEDPGLFTLPCRLGDLKPFDTLADLGTCVNIIPLYLFKKLNIRLLEETNHIFGLADGTKSYPVGIVKDVEVHIGKLKLLNDFYVIDMKKDPETPLLVGR
ncbi:MAK10-like protein [Tanacetum coccineum]